MSKYFKETLSLRLVAVALSLVVAISFLPVFGGQVFAANGQQEQQVQQEAPPVPQDAYAVTIASAGTGFTIKGEIPAKYRTDPYNYVFGKVFVDGTEVKDFTGSTSIAAQTISLDQFNTGYHTVFLQLYDSKRPEQPVRLIFQEKIPCNKITSRPTYKGAFDVYSKYFNYYPYNLALENQEAPLYMEYKLKNAKSWKRTGQMQANAIKLYTEQGFKISGLKPDREYNTRIRYGTYVTYAKLTPEAFNMTLEQFQKIFGTTRTYLGDGQTYFFGGPTKSTGTYKTGKGSKPKVRSVKVNVTNVKFHKVKHYGKYTGVYLYTEKFYTYKIKVTVNLKQKPGTKGIWLNGRWLSGNKKKYTTVFSPYPNYASKKPPKGFKKYKVSIQSGQNKSYGGYSPAFSKSYAVKK